jgi:DNA-binding response OmpR family regulator
MGHQLESGDDLRRTRHRPAAGRMRVGSLELDPLSREVWVQGKRVALSKKE